MYVQLYVSIFCSYVVICKLAAPQAVQLYVAEEMIEPRALGASSLTVDRSGKTLFRTTSQIVVRRVSDG